MKCPICKSRATKLYDLSTGKMTCQVCWYVWLAIGANST